MESRSIPQGPEVRLLAERFAARLLHERERLGSRKQPEALAGEVGADEAVGERANRLHAQVHPRVPLAGEPLEQLMADRQRRRDEDLFGERLLAADARELQDQPRARPRGCRRRRGLRLVVEGKEGLGRHRGPFLFRWRTNEVRP